MGEDISLTALKMTEINTGRNVTTITVQHMQLAIGSNSSSFIQLKYMLYITCCQVKLQYAAILYIVQLDFNLTLVFFHRFFRVIS